MEKLPEKTSALIRVALADLIKCEADDRFVIDMNYWHSHMRVEPGNTEKRCFVCLAGAALSQTAAIPHEWATNDVWDALARNDANRQRVFALDCVREGNIVTAVERVEAWTTNPVDRAVKLRRIEDAHRYEYRSYSDDPDAFKVWLELVAADLEQVGY